LAKYCYGLSPLERHLKIERKKKKEKLLPEISLNLLIIWDKLKPILDIIKLERKEEKN